MSLSAENDGAEGVANNVGFSVHSPIQAGKECATNSPIQWGPDSNPFLPPVGGHHGFRPGAYLPELLNHYCCLRNLWVTVSNRRWEVWPTQLANPMERAWLRLVAVCSQLPFEPVCPFR